MEVWRHLQPDGACVVHFDNHAMDHRNDTVSGERVLPGAQLRMADFGFYKVHLADIAFVLLLCSNLPRIRRPEENCTVTAGPSGVVGGVAEVLHTVSGELFLLARRYITCPKVPVADEGFPLAIRRDNGCAGASPATSSSAESC